MNSTRIGIIDYGMGNLQSVRNALERIGCAVNFVSAPDQLHEADALILPGVGAFGEAMNNLRKRSLTDALRSAVLEDGIPLLGICLGMQLLAESSEERGQFSGLSLIPGHVKQVPVRDELRLPHIGWNGVSVVRREPLFRDIHDGGAFYFVHSYRFECGAEHVAGTTDYGSSITAAVQKDRIFGVQFHPERSQRKGLRLLRNFVDFAESTARNG